VWFFVGFVFCGLGQARAGAPKKTNHTKGDEKAAGSKVAPGRNKKLMAKV
jgi:hypothetical protein